MLTKTEEERAMNVLLGGGGETMYGTPDGTVMGWLETKNGKAATLVCRTASASIGPSGL